MDRIEKAAKIAHWTAERDELKPLLTSLYKEVSEARELYDEISARTMKIKNKFDALDRKIANIDKIKVVRASGPSSKRGGKKKQTLDFKQVFKSMSSEKQQEFLNSLTE